MRWRGVTLLVTLQVCVCLAQSRHNHHGNHSHAIRNRSNELTARVSASTGPERSQQSSALASSLEPGNQTYTSSPYNYKRDFYVFHNVVLRNDSLLYFHTDESVPLPDDLPMRLRLSREEAEFDVPLIVVNSSNRNNFTEICDPGQMNKVPGLLFSGPPWDHNFYEFLVNTMMPAFQGAVMTGLLDLGRMKALSEMQWRGFADREPFMDALYDSHSPFTLISARASAFGAPWAYFLENWTRDLQALHRMTGSCFPTLVVVEDAVLRYIMTKIDLMQDPGYYNYRVHWLKEFQKHVQHSEHVRLRADKEQDWPRAPHDSGARWGTNDWVHRPRVVIATRPKDRRELLNEPEIVDYLVDNWDVNVTVTKFKDGLAEAIALMQDTDVIIGVHGAGLTNAVFMKPGGVLLQLLPYGFTINETTHRRIRGNIFVDIALSLNGTYLQWENHEPENAYFVKPFWEDARKHWQSRHGNQIGEFQLHPDDSLQLPRECQQDCHDPAVFWMYQNTMINMTELSPILDDAMEAIHASRKARPSTGSA